MGNYLAEYYEPLHTLRITKYIPGCGSIDSETKVIAVLSPKDTTDFKKSLDGAIAIMEKVEIERDKARIAKLINKKSSLQAEINEIDRILEKQND